MTITFEFLALLSGLLLFFAIAGIVGDWITKHTEDL